MGHISLDPEAFIKISLYKWKIVRERRKEGKGEKKHKYLSYCFSNLQRWKCIQSLSFVSKQPSRCEEQQSQQFLWMHIGEYAQIHTVSLL